VQVENIFWYIHTVLPFANAHHVLSLGQLDIILERDVVPDFLKGLFELLRISESVVDLETEK